MPLRCEKGTRRNKKTGNCEPHTTTKKNRKSAPPTPSTPPAKKLIRKIKRAALPQKAESPKPHPQRLTDARLKNELTNIIKELEEELKEIKDENKAKFTKEQKQESLKYKKMLDAQTDADAHAIKTFEALHHNRPELRMRDLDAAIATLKNHRKNKNFEFARQLAM